MPNSININIDGLDVASLPAKVSQYLEYESAISTFQLEDGAWDSIEEMEAHIAQGSIIFAKNEILKLQARIKQFEQVIDDSNLKIHKYKLHSKSKESRGRPQRHEQREYVAKKFTMLWVGALIQILEADGCGSKLGLERFLPTVKERSWRRWLNGESIPSYKTFEKLLYETVQEGKFAGTTLMEIPIYPSHSQILTLLKFL